MGPFTRAGALASVSALALCVAPGLSVKPAQAQSFTVSNGQTAGHHAMTGTGDTGHIEQGGKIETADQIAVQMIAPDQSVLNEGIVSTTGAGAVAIMSTSTNATITNRGDITTAGNDLSTGIFAGGPDAVIDNSGTISTDFANGIWATGGRAKVTNSGTVSTTEDDAIAIRSNGTDAAITNSGTISTEGWFADGIHSTGADAVIVNSGEISTTGFLAAGIASDIGGIGATIINNGAISTTGLGGLGIESRAGNAVIRNSGTITTADGSAVGIYSVGDNAVIENSGSITTPNVNAHGISSDGADATIRNSGTISTGSIGILAGGPNASIENSGTIFANDYGIYSTDADAVIVSSGLISTQGNNGHGIYFTQADATVTNSGVITTTGMSANGILASGSGAVVDNSGAILTTGQGANAVVFNEVDAVIRNSGTIAAEGQGAIGLFSSSSGMVLVNSGAISAADAPGIFSFGSSLTIINSGTISAAGIAVESYGSNAVITNSGSIISEQDNSIRMGANATLNLLRGSVLKGNVWFASPGSATLNIGPGLSTALQVDGIPATINAFGMPLVVTADAVYTADVTAIGHEGEALADLTSGIFSAIGGRRSGDGAAVPLSYAPDKAPQTKVFRTDDVPVREAWLKGFGGMRNEDGENGSPGYDQALAGFVSGMDVFASQAGIAGVFLGGSWGQTDVELSQEIDALSGYGGVYGTFGLGTATLDVALAAGFSSYESERRVNNSLVGIETADAEYDGWFVSPHLALTQPFVISGQIVEAKVSAHYAGLFLDGYEETGSASNLSVGERDVHVFVGRAGLSVPVAFAHAGGGVTIVTPSFGVEGRAQFGDSTAAGSFIGTDIVLALDDDESVGGYAGLKVENETASGLTFFAAAEGLIEDDGATRVFAKSGVKALF